MKFKRCQSSTTSFLEQALDLLRAPSFYRNSFHERLTARSSAFSTRVVASLFSVFRLKFSSSRFLHFLLPLINMLVLRLNFDSSVSPHLMDHQNSSFSLFHHFHLFSERRQLHPSIQRNGFYLFLAVVRQMASRFFSAAQITPKLTSKFSQVAI